MQSENAGEYFYAAKWIMEAIPQLLNTMYDNESALKICVNRCVNKWTNLISSSQSQVLQIVLKISIKPQYGSLLFSSTYDIAKIISPQLSCLRLQNVSQPLMVRNESQRAFPGILEKKRDALPVPSENITEIARDTPLNPRENSKGDLRTQESRSQQWLTRGNHQLQSQTPSESLLALMLLTWQGKCFQEVAVDFEAVGEEVAKVVFSQGERAQPLKRCWKNNTFRSADPRENPAHPRRWWKK